jgi:hypothetical protein
MWNAIDDNEQISYLINILDKYITQRDYNNTLDIPPASKLTYQLTFDKFIIAEEICQNLNTNFLKFFRNNNLNVYYVRHKNEKFALNFNNGKFAGVYETIF